MSSESSGGVLVAVLGCTGAILAAPLISLFSTTYTTCAAIILWRWFIEPHTHASAPAFAVFVGCSLIYGLYRGNSAFAIIDAIKPEYLKPSKDRLTQGLITLIIGPPASVGMAWLIHLFVK